MTLTTTTTYRCKRCKNPNIKYDRNTTPDLNKAYECDICKVRDRRKSGLRAIERVDWILAEDMVMALQDLDGDVSFEELFMEIQEIAKAITRRSHEAEALFNADIEEE